MAPSLASAAGLGMIAANLAPVARIAGLFSGFASSAQDVVDFLSVHCTTEGFVGFEESGSESSESEHHG